MPLQTVHTPPSRPVSPDDLLTTEEVAEWLRVPVKTIYWWRQERRAPKAVLLGRTLRWRRGDVAAWLAEK